MSKRGCAGREPDDLRRFSAAAFFAVLLLYSPAFASDMGITAKQFLSNLGYASSKVERGISSASINSSFNKTSTGCAVEYDSSIIIVINENVDGNVRNLAVTYVPDAEEPHKRYMKGGPPPTEVVFAGICMQVIFALHRDMTRKKAHSVLDNIGLYGGAIDGVQRSERVGDYNYIMKMQPSGLLIMAVSHI